MDKGQSLVELAISFVILMFLLSGAVEFGISFFQYVQLLDAVQEGALYASMYPHDVDGIEVRTRSASNAPLNLMDDAVSISVTPHGVACEGNGIEVRATYQHKLFMPFLPTLIGRDTIPLSAYVVDTIMMPRCQ